MRCSRPRLHRDTLLVNDSSPPLPTLDDRLLARAALKKALQQD
jgi:hypothetical protein